MISLNDKKLVGVFDILYHDELESNIVSNDCFIFDLDFDTTSTTDKT